MRGALSVPTLPMACMACAVLAALMVASPAPAQPTDPDPWFAEDKMLHFGVSTSVTSVMYVGSATQLEARYECLFVAGGIAMSLGTGREVYKALGHGDPSIRDYTWDVIGTVVGLVVTWGIDLIVRGVDDAHPLFGAPRRPH